MIENIKKLFICILGIVLLGVTYKDVSYLLENKESEGRYSAFFNEMEDIDVLFFGSSHVRHGFFPMELFRDYGIVSYNLAGNGDTIPVTFWKMNMSIDYKKPMLAVVDVYDLWPGKKITEIGIGQVHDSLDYFPLTKKKIEAINDLFDEEDRMEMMWKMSTYHNRWKDLESKDFIVNYDSSTCKGSCPLYGQEDRLVNECSYEENEIERDVLSEEYLNRIIELCDKENIEILLINTGYDVNAESQAFADLAENIAKVNSINYLDFTKIDVINMDTDICTSGQNTHVNESGALKLTDHIGKYICDNYGIMDYRNDSKYSSWYDNYEPYVKAKRDYLSNETDLLPILSGMYDTDYSVYVYVDFETALISESTVRMLRNITHGKNLDNLEDSRANGKRYFLIQDNIEKRTYEMNSNIQVAGLKTAIADILRESIDEPMGNIQVVVINNYTRSVVLNAQWNNDERLH